jgi:hypothetical protein
MVRQGRPVLIVTFGGSFVRARVLVSVAVAATIALGATGCEFMTSPDTKFIKQVSDGVNTSVGSVDVRNALLISDTGKSARFVGTFVNNDSTAHTVTVEVGSASDTVRVPANSHVDLAASGATSKAQSSTEQGTSEQGTSEASGDDLTFQKITAKPGSLVKAYFSYPGAEGVSLRVPVLTSAQEEYQTLAPMTPTPSSTPTTPAGNGTTPTGGATAPGTQPTDSQTDSSAGDSGTNG